MNDLQALRKLMARTDPQTIADTHVKQAVRLVSLATGIQQQFIYSNDKGARVARARQAAMYIAYQAGVSLSAIGRSLGRDHSTVLHGIRAEAKRRGEA